MQNSLFGEASGASEDDRENSLKGSSGANLLEREEDEEARTNENRARLTGNPDLAGTPVKVLSLSLSLSFFLCFSLGTHRVLCVVGNPSRNPERIIIHGMSLAALASRILSSLGIEFLITDMLPLTAGIFFIIRDVLLNTL